MRFFKSSHVVMGMLLACNSIDAAPFSARFFGDQIEGVLSTGYSVAINNRTAFGNGDVTWIFTPEQEGFENSGLPIWFTDVANPFSVVTLAKEARGLPNGLREPWAPSPNYTGWIPGSYTSFSFSAASGGTIENNSSYNFVGGPLGQYIYTRYDIRYTNMQSIVNGIVSIKSDTGKCLLCGVFVGNARISGVLQGLGQNSQIYPTLSMTRTTYEVEGQFIPDVPEPNALIVLAGGAIWGAIALARRKRRFVDDVNVV